MAKVNSRSVKAKRTLSIGGQSLREMLVQMSQSAQRRLVESLLRDFNRGQFLRIPSTTGFGEQAHRGESVGSDSPSRSTTVGGEHAARD